MSLREGLNKKNDGGGTGPFTNQCAACNEPAPTDNNGEPIYKFTGNRYFGSVKLCAICYSVGYHSPQVLETQLEFLEMARKNFELDQGSEGVVAYDPKTGKRTVH